LDVHGGLTTGTVKATVTDSVAATNGGGGFVSTSFSTGAPTTVTVVRSVAVNNGTGLIAAGTPATLRGSQSTGAGNIQDWLTTGRVVLSAQDNTIEGNTMDEAAPPTYAQK